MNSGMQPISARGRFQMLGSLLAVILLFFAGAALAESEAKKHPASVRLTAMHSALSNTGAETQSGTELALVFDIEPGWHIYWQNSGESAMPTTVKWTAPNGWNIGSLQWQSPFRFIERGEITTFGYKNEAILFAELSPEVPQAYQNESISVDALVKWLVCKDVCIPGKAEVQLTLPIQEGAPELSEDAALLEEGKQALPLESLPGVELKTHLKDSSFAANTESEITLEVRGLKPVEDKAAEVQLFALADKHISLGAPKTVWVEDTLYVRAPISFAASTEAGLHELAGVLVVSEAHSEAKWEGPVSLRWDTALAVSDSAAEVNLEYAKIDRAVSDTTDSSFQNSSYRLVRWDAAKEVNEESADSAGQSPTPLQEAPQTGFWLVLLFAFLGGMILNLMPCVLPIIAIKVMGFIEQSESGSKGGATAFCAGVMFSFIVLAGVVIALRSLGVQLGWGFQFQHPEFVFIITLIVFVLALGFFDLYVVALPFMQRACSAVDTLEPSRLKHFFDGVIATILSTPCTAPFLGTALVFAFTQGPLATLAIHLAIGLGLATPYFVLATNPKFLSVLPKPGTWMHKLRQLMGFMLLGTVIWLLFVLQKLTGEGVIWTQLLMLTLVFCVWLYEWSKGWTATSRRLVRFFAAALLLFSALHLFPKATARVQHGEAQSVEKNGIVWEAYSKEAVDQALAANTPVFIDFTADWCITCKANEMLIINTDKFSSALKEYGVTPFIADWTDGDEHITVALSSYGARGVPLYVVVSPNDKDNPVVLSTIPSTAALVEALKAARAK